MGDEAKLPRWARDELSRLRADLEYTRRQMAELMGPAGQESTDTYHGPHAAELHPLPAQSLIRFTLPVPGCVMVRQTDLAPGQARRPTPEGRRAAVSSGVCPSSALVAPRNDRSVH